MTICGNCSGELWMSSTGWAHREPADSHYCGAAEPAIEDSTAGDGWVAGICYHVQHCGATPLSPCNARRPRRGTR